jgi:hypothetical protein
MNAHRDPVLQRQPAVTGDVVGVRVSLDRPNDMNSQVLRLGEDRLDRERRVDDDRFPRLLAAHEIRGTAEIVVQDL